MEGDEAIFLTILEDGGGVAEGTTRVSGPLLVAVRVGSLFTNKGGGGVHLAVNERDSLAECLFPGLDSGANVEVDAVARLRVLWLGLILIQQYHCLAQKVELWGTRKLFPTGILCIWVHL